MKLKEFHAKAVKMAEEKAKIAKEALKI